MKKNKRNLRMAVVGSREIKDEKFVLHVISYAARTFKTRLNKSVGTIVSGGAVGVDSFSESWAALHGKKVLVFKPDWKTLGKQAGYVRNVEIINNSDCVLAIWDGESRGTKHSISIARQAELPLIVITAADMENAPGVV